MVRTVIQWLVQRYHSLATVIFVIVCSLAVSLSAVQPTYAIEDTTGDTTGGTTTEIAESAATEADVIPLSRTNWDATLAIPRFDATLGILTKIEFMLTGQVDGAVRIENLDAQPATVIAESIADVTLERPDGTFITMVSPSAAKSATLAAFDGVIDFGGTSGTTVDNIIGIDISERTVYTVAVELEKFIGSGSIDLTVSATGRSRATGAGNLGLSFNTLAGAAITVTYTYVQPAIALEKATNGIDADQLPGPTLFHGDPVTWTYVVTNVGGTPLEDLTLVDDREGNVTAGCPQTTLAVGESMTCTTTGIVQQGQYTNTAVVTGRVPSDMPGQPRQVTANDPSHYTGVGDPAIDLEKLTNGEDADLLPGPLVAAGDMVTWTYIVRNIGEIDLADLTLTDDREGNVTAGCPQRTLAVGEAMSCVVTGIAQPGQYANTAMVTGTTPVDAIHPNMSVTDSDPSHYLGTTLAVCPVDAQGNVILPQLRYLGEGAGDYTLAEDEEAFVVKKLAPFRFINRAGPSYQSTKVTGTPERIWACRGDCRFTRAVEEAIDLGLLPADATLYAVVLDDDPDVRINWLSVDGNLTSPTIQLVEQSLTQYLEIELPQTGVWQFYADDSIGIHMCITQ